MMDYRLHVFRQVAELRSLTRASKALRLSQPAVTKHIKLLEEELRLPLFVRSSHGVELTDAGTVFLKHVQTTERERAAILEQLQAPVGKLTGGIRLGGSMTITSYYLPEILLAFKTKYPDVRCTVVEGNTEFILGLLLNQRIDLGLVEGPCHRREVQARPFYEDEIIWIASPSDALAGAKKVTVQNLIERPIISRELGSGTRKVVEGALRHQGIALAKLNIVQELPSTEAIKRMVAAGAGIGYASRLSVHQELASGKLARIHCPKMQIKRNFSILTPQGPDPVGTMQAFSQFLIQKSHEPRQ
ncbi:MAG TPA: LysR substrate-binding domain-containing protein [Candidatus Sulfotelmatobacter sp.]|nr:LysR substrate-binding domain-containing protein [Candidatus Sulfotelmatobacter sp.]